MTTFMVVVKENTGLCRQATVSGSLMVIFVFD